MPEINPLWSWSIALLSVTGLHASASGRRWGFLLSLASQAVQVVYGLLTQQPGFVLVVGVRLYAYWQHWRRY